MTVCGMCDGRRYIPTSRYGLVECDLCGGEGNYDDQGDELMDSEGTPSGSALIDASSFGTPAAIAMRATVTDDHAARLVARANALTDKEK